MANSGRGYEPFLQRIQRRKWGECSAHNGFGPAN